jgi:hypothetical protein
MDQCSNVIDVKRKGLTAIEIHRYLVVALEPEAVAHSLVTFYLRSLSFRSQKMTAIKSECRTGDVDVAILTETADGPFASGRELPQYIHLP